MSKKFYIVDENGSKHGGYGDINFAREMARQEILLSVREMPVKVFSVSKFGPFYEGEVFKYGRGFRWSTSASHDVSTAINANGTLKKKAGEGQMHPFGL